MHAILTQGYGSAEVLIPGEIPVPIIKDNEYLVKVLGSSVNPVDWKVRKGEVRFFSGYKAPRVLGADFSGIIEASGHNARRFRPGDAVFGMVPAFKGGAYADYVKVTQKNLALKPKNLSFTEAATLPLVSLTAYQGLVEKIKLQPGKRIMVNGCCGGVGHVVMQIAKLLGCHVTGVCSGDKRDLALKLGADQVLDYRMDSLVAENGAYDVFFDAVNNQSFASVRSSMTDTGCYVTTMPAFGNLILAPILNRFRRQKELSLWVRPNSNALEIISNWVESGKLLPLVSETYPLNEIREAHQRSESGRVAGKIALDNIGSSTI